MTDRSDAVVVHIDPTYEAARKLVFEPRSDGWTLIEKEWDGDHYRTVGSKGVRHVSVSTPGDRLVPGVETPE